MEEESLEEALRPAAGRTQDSREERAVGRYWAIPVGWRSEAGCDDGSIPCLVADRAIPWTAADLAAQPEVWSGEARDELVEELGCLRQKVVLVPKAAVLASNL